MKATNPLKPGALTSEFFLSLAAVFLGLILPVLRPETTLAHVLGMVAAGLAAMGYSVSRGVVKAQALKCGMCPPEQPAKKGPPETTKALGSASKALAPMLVFFSVATFAWTGCCALKGTCKESPAQVAIDCTKEVVRERAPQILPLVSDVLAHGADWKVDLVALATALGTDGVAIVDCTVARLVDQTGKPTAGPDEERVHDRGTEWLNGKTLRRP